MKHFTDKQMKIDSPQQIIAMDKQMVDQMGAVCSKVKNDIQLLNEKTSCSHKLFSFQGFTCSEIKINFSQLHVNARGEGLKQLWLVIKKASLLRSQELWALSSPSNLYSTCN